MSKNIRPKNKEGKPHGYWESYYSDGKIWIKGYWNNGERHGYREEYYSNGQLAYKGYYDNGLRVGYWEDYWNWDDGIRIYI